MVVKFSLYSLFFLTLFSCNKDVSKDVSTLKIKVFNAEKNECYMLHSSYSNESVRWDRVIACFNKNDNNISQSSFVINFPTENFLIKHEIDSAFVVLMPNSEENIGDNRMSVSLLKDKFSNLNNWNNKPIVNSEFYAVSKSVSSANEKKIRIDVSNLVKYQSENYKFNLPLIFDLYNDNLSDATSASFYSTNVDVEEVQPKLEVYYSK